MTVSGIEQKSEGFGLDMLCIGGPSALCQTAYIPAKYLHPTPMTVLQWSISFRRCLPFGGGVGGRLLPDAKVLRDDGSRVASGNIRGVLSQPHPTICVSGWPPTRAPKWAIDPGPEDPCRIGGSYLLGAKLGRSA